MQSKKIILITGATGAQGGSVAKALLQQKEWVVRIFTRNPDSTAANELASLGAEVQQGDFNDPLSLKIALKDVYAVFGVTSFWEHYEKEYEQGENLVNAVSQSSVKHFIFSSLENYFEKTGQTISVPHYDQKARLKNKIRELGIPASFVQLSFYYQNFLTWFLPRPTEKGYYEFGFPQGNTKLASVNVNDLGPLVNTMLNHPDVYLGRTVDVVGADLSGDDYARILSQTTGLDIRYKYIPRDIYRKMDVPAAEEFANMFDVQRVYYPEHQLALIESYGLNEKMESFQSWAEKHKAVFRKTLKEQATLVNV